MNMFEKQRDDTVSSPIIGSERLRKYRVAAIVGVAGIIILANATHVPSDAIAGTKLVDGALASAPGTGYVAQNRLGQSVNVTSNSCGYSLTINTIYADMNRVIAGFTVSGPTGRSFGNLAPEGESKLTLASGLVLPALAGMTNPAESNTSGGYLAFDAADVTPGATSLALNLIIPSISAVERVGKNPVTVACETYHSLNVPDTRLVVTSGPLHFALSVPIDPRVHDLHPQQVGQLKSAPVSLDRVIVTPSETRIYVSGNAAGYDDLIVNGNDYGTMPGLLNGCRATADGAESVCSYNVSLFDLQHDLTIVAHANQATGDGSQPSSDSAAFHIAFH